MGTKTKWRIAVAFVQNVTLGQTYKSAPTGGYHKFDGAGGWVCAMAILFQRPRFSSL